MRNVEGKGWSEKVVKWYFTLLLLFIVLLISIVVTVGMGAVSISYDRILSMIFEKVGEAIASRSFEPFSAHSLNSEENIFFNIMLCVSLTI